MSGLVILGGGVAGIAASYTANKIGIKNELFEASSRTGGLLDNFSVSNFRFDHAVHLSFTQNEYVRSIFDCVPYVTHKPTPRNYEKNKWFKHPIQNNLFPLSAEEKVHAIKDFINRPVHKNIQNYEDWLFHQYGTYITERFPLKYTEKYWNVPANQLTTDWIGNRMYQPSIDEVLYGAFTDQTPNTYYAAHMRYPQVGGYKAFISPMEKEVMIHTNKRAVELDVKNRLVYFQDGKNVYYDNLISSIPLPEIISIMRDVPQEIQSAADALWATSIALVSIGFNQPDIAKDLWFYIYDEDILASRAYSPSLKSRDNVPENCSSYQFEIYFSKNRPLPMTKDLLLEHIIESLVKMKITSKSDIIVTDVRTIPYGNVVFDHNIKVCREKVIRFLMNQRIYPIGRFGEWNYLWSDQSLLSGKNMVEKLYSKNPEK